MTAARVAHWEPKYTGMTKTQDEVRDEFRTVLAEVAAAVAEREARGEPQPQDGTTLIFELE